MKFLKRNDFLSVKFFYFTVEIVLKNPKFILEGHGSIQGNTLEFFAALCMPKTKCEELQHIS